MIDGRAWRHAGGIGMPANDGTREGWYLSTWAREQQLITTGFPSGSVVLALNVNIHVHMPVADETPVDLRFRENE